MARRRPRRVGFLFWIAASDRPDSDVDLLVDSPPDIGLLGLGRVQAELEAILGTKVDLVPKQAFGAVASFYATH